MEVSILLNLRILRRECRETDLPWEGGIVGYSQSNVLEKFMLILPLWVDINIIKKRIKRAETNALGRCFFSMTVFQLHHVPTDIIPLMLLLEVDTDVRNETRLPDYSNIYSLFKWLKKLEKFPFSLAKKMPLILCLFTQTQSSLISNGVSSVLMDEKCKIFPDHPLTCTCAHTRVHDLFYFLNHRGRMHRLLIWIKYSYFFLFPLQVCV